MHAGEHFVLLLFALGLAFADTGSVAFLKGNHVFVSDEAGDSVRQIDNDTRRKGLLRWDPYSRRLSVLVDRKDKREVERVAVMQLDGTIIAEASIPPITDPPTCCMRFVSDLSWLPNGKLRIEGSVNPMNCLLFDLDVQTGQDSNWYSGVCGDFIASPDRKHMIARHKNYPGPEEEQIDVMQLDDKERFYRGNDPNGVFWLTQPVWSPDSQKIALIEREYTTGNVSAVVLSLTGAVVRIRVTREVAEHPAVTWVGDAVVVGERGILQIDPGSKFSSTRLSLDAANALKASKIRQTDAERKTKRIEELVNRLGGREGIPLQ